MNTNYDEAADLEADRATEINELRGKIFHLVGAAAQGASTAGVLVTKLAAPNVYDIEVAEGSLGTDLAAELATAARSLRNAARIMRELEATS